MYLDRDRKKYEADIAINWLQEHLPNGPFSGELERYLKKFPEEAAVIQKAFEMAVQSGYDYANQSPAPLKDVGRGDM